MSISVGLVIRDIGPMGGIGRYTKNIVDGVSASSRLRSEIALIGPAQQEWVGNVRQVSVPAVPFGGSLALLKTARAGWDVAYFPFHEQWPVFAALPFRIVMMIQSVEPLFLERTETISGTRSYRFLKLVRRRLALALAPSNQTADEISEHLRIPRDRVRAIPYGVDHGVFSPGPIPASGRPYVLNVALHQPQKNVVRLIEAFAAAELDPDVELLIAGDVSRCGDDYRSAIARCGLGARVRLLGALADDRRLAELYRGALVFALPSLQESFGLPALEAMACGCPVVVSKGTGVGELVEGAGVTVDPRDVDAIAAGLVEAAGNRELARRGVDRASSYTWERSVESHIDAFEAAAR